MKDFQIGLKEDELRILIKLAYTGSYVVDNDGHKDSEKIEEVLEKLLKMAKEGNLYKGLEYDKKLEGHFFDKKSEDEMLEEYEEFIEDSFWETLVFQLSERDIVEEMGIDKFQKLDMEKRLEKFSTAEQKYYEEFEKNGIRNLRLTNKK